MQILHGISFKIFITQNSWNPLFFRSFIFFTFWLYCMEVLIEIYVSAQSCIMKKEVFALDDPSELKKLPM